MSSSTSTEASRFLRRRDLGFRARCGVGAPFAQPLPTSLSLPQFANEGCGIETKAAAKAIAGKTRKAFFILILSDPYKFCPHVKNINDKISASQFSNNKVPSGGF
jgi:hypothetical protein